MKALSIHSIPRASDDHRFFPEEPPDTAVQVQAVVPGFAKLPANVIGEDVLLIQEKLPLNPTRRLVVLVPPGEVDETALARRVWQLADSSSFNVLYLALSPDDSQAAYQRRRLASLAALTSGLDIHAQTCVSAENKWHQALEGTLQHGDLLVCLASHQVPEHIFWHRNLGEQLVETAGVPVYLLAGLEIVPLHQEVRAIREALVWLAFLFVIVAFFSLQVSIDRATDGPFSTILLCLSVAAEVYLLWKINQWIG